MYEQEGVYTGKKNINIQINHSRNLDHVLKSLEDQIELTVYNYQNLLQTQKKTSGERAEFLLYLVQSLRLRHVQEIQNLSMQVTTAEGQKQSAQTMQKQMENIGEGLDQIMQESNKLKAQNQDLNRQLEESETKQKELDNEIRIVQQEMEDIREKIDEWQKVKIKWNRHKKQLLQMIEDSQKIVTEHPFNKSQVSSVEGKNVCGFTGQDTAICEHCQNSKIQELFLKYNSTQNNGINSRKMT